MKNLTVKKEKSPNRVAYLVILGIVLLAVGLVGGIAGVIVYVLSVSRDIMISPTGGL